MSNTEWMQGSLGISLHWTADTKPIDGQACSFQDAVDRFDLDRLLEQIIRSGANHVIFTTNHAGEFCAGPNPILDYLLPGRTCERDLLGELAARLHQAGIKLIFYRNPACNNGDDEAWRIASWFGKPPYELYLSHLITIVEYLSLRYARYLSGWWFDCGYSLDARYPEHRVPKGMDAWKFPWKALYTAAKAGKSDCAVAFNSGANETRFYTDLQDYTAGEVTTLDFQPRGRFLNEMQLHLWTCLDNNRWVHNQPDTPFAQPLYSDEQLATFVERIIGVGGALTLNVEIDQTGLISESAIAQLRRIRRL